VQGIGRGHFESTNKAVFADFFPGSKSEPAFANFVIWSGLSMTIGYFILPHLSSAVSSLLCVFSAVVGGVCYMVAEREYCSTQPTQSQSHTQRQPPSYSALSVLEEHDVSLRLPA
jgi:hypothetical protein